MIVDTALLERGKSGKPIRVGVIGAGAAGRAIALQMATPPQGIRLAAIVNRTRERGERAFREAGVSEWRNVQSAREAEAAINQGIPILTDDPSVVTSCGAVDLIIEGTGTIEYAARIVLDAFHHGKHVVLVNAELDSFLVRF